MGKLQNARMLWAVALLGGLAVLAGPVCGAVIHDLEWGDKDGEDRDDEKCGTVAVSNLFLEWNDEQPGLVKDPADTDALKTDVENRSKPQVGKENPLTDRKMVEVIEGYLKANGFKGTVAYHPMFEGDTLTWDWLKKEWDDDEKLNILVEDGKDKDGNTIRHWLTVTGLDAEGNLSVVDPNTDPGQQDSYKVDTDGLTFELPYDFAGEQTQDGKSPVTIVSAVKVSDVQKIPEPATMAFLAAGGVALLRRRRR